MVGSGVGGSTLAYALAQRGAEVLVVEQGDFLRPNPARIGVPSIPMNELKDVAEHCVGGPSKFYGAALYRLRELDFTAFSTETGESPAWPISYKDLEPFYSEAERLFGVRGSTTEDPTEPFHSKPYPFGPIEHEPYLAPVVHRLRAQGLPVSYIPKAVDFGPGGRCVLCSRCDSYYCQLDAKMDAEIAALRPALATGRAELFTRTTCRRVLTNADGRRATKVLLSRDGTEFIIDAGLVALCTGVLQTPVLLRHSDSAASPAGIGNASGSVGKYLAGHSAGLLFATRGQRLPPLHQKTFAVNAFYGPSAEWPYPMGVIQAAGQLPVWTMVPPRLAPLVRALVERSVTCCLMTEAVPTREAGLVFSPDGTIRIVNPPHRLQTYSRLRRRAIRALRQAGFPVVVGRPRPGALWHPVGTARFGEDPATSVLDPTCRIHGMENMYVVDASSLPSAGALNTSLTIIALALRTAALIADERGGAEGNVQRTVPARPS